MADTAYNLLRLIQLAQRKGIEPLQVSVGTAKNVDEQKRTCDIEIDTDLTLLNCRLNAVVDNYDNQLLVLPKEGGKVAFAPIDGQMTDVLVIGYSDIEKVLLKVGESEIEIADGSIVINGGDNDGMVKIKELTDKLNALEQRCNDLLTALQGVTITLAPSGEFPLASYFVMKPLTNTAKSELENTKVKH